MHDLLDRRSFVGWTGALAACAVATKALGATAGPSAGDAIPGDRIDKAIARLDELAAAIMAKTGIPGMAVCVVHGGKTAYSKGFGVRKAGASQPVDADTVFQLASLSKSLAATVVAQQVGKGAVTWDTPVAAKMPWFTLSDPWIGRHVTIGDMFSHRSGLPDHAGDDLEDFGFDRRTILERLRLLPLHGFRDIYAYTNFGLTAAAEAVATAAGKDWASLSEEVLYGPLGLSATSSRFADFERQPNRAVGHVRIEGAYRPGPQRMPDPQSPAGGVSSSANDLARWMAMVLAAGQFEGRRIVPAQALLPAFSAQMVAAKSATIDALPGLYGYGVGVGVTASGRIEISHSGAFALGAATRYAMIPALDIGIIVLTNASPCGGAETLGREFLDLVEVGSITRDWFALINPIFTAMLEPEGDLLGKSPPASAKAAAPLSSYTGTYGNAYFGDVDIAEAGNGLQLKIGPKASSYPLRHWDGDVFAIAPSSENEADGSLSSVRFVRTEGAPARELTVDYLDKNGLGRFERR
ncbi:serine hydrolase [Labrys miyagiensis]|uniref:Serine hydrolase n=1 Tax=Labrys miyagiensis TaxID=346912 RepID=A0ABQ6CTT7_9HYPH|nr:serine hydrolase [Labrys miyagiensis]GLS23529.1 serine hydrolase [Labrys miyagiensis]